MARPAIPEASRRRLDEAVERLRSLVPDDWNVTVAHRQPDLGVVSITADDGTEATVSDRLPGSDGQCRGSAPPTGAVCASRGSIERSEPDAEQRADAARPTCLGADADLDRRRSALHGRRPLRGARHRRRLRVTRPADTRQPATDLSAAARPGRRSAAHAAAVAVVGEGAVVETDE